MKRTKGQDKQTPIPKRKKKNENRYEHSTNLPSISTMVYTNSLQSTGSYSLNDEHSNHLSNSDLRIASSKKQKSDTILCTRNPVSNRILGLNSTSPYSIINPNQCNDQSQCLLSPTIAILNNVPNQKTSISKTKIQKNQYEYNINSLSTHKVLDTNPSPSTSFHILNEHSNNHCNSILNNVSSQKQKKFDTIICTRNPVALNGIAHKKKTALMNFLNLNSTPSNSINPNRCDDQTERLLSPTIPILNNVPNQKTPISKTKKQKNRYEYNINSLSTHKVLDTNSSPSTSFHILNEHSNNHCNSNLSNVPSQDQTEPLLSPPISTHTISPSTLHFSNDHTYSQPNQTIAQSVVRDQHSHPLIHRTRYVHNVSSDNDYERLNNIEEHYLGPMNVTCVHCGAKHFAAEKVANKKNSFNDCCSHGKVQLEPLPKPPPVLEQLFNGTHEHSQHFYERIRYYNNSFSFASFNANLIQFNNRRPGPYCFKIQGQIYYQINTSLYPANDELPRYGQLFIVDSNEAVGHRLNVNNTLNEDILRSLDNEMRQFNSFAKSYQMMKEELQEMTEQNNGDEPELQLLFKVTNEHDRRRYNFQRVNEVAAIFSTTVNGEIPDSYVSVRNRSTKVLHNVSTMNEFVEPWTYPLFYSHGTLGWHKDMRLISSNRRVTRGDYCQYRIAIREETNYLLMGRRLFQQYVVDSYVKIEQDQMNFLRFNQKKLRADSYAGLQEHLQSRAENENSRIGKVVILPSSHVGSPRYMQQVYQDATTIVGKFGKPDLFITMTCNPKWREITENLLEGQQASDRPDLVARVFDLKKKELLRIIVEEKLFGEVRAYVFVVEYQKRGLPHIHLLVTLQPNSKITTPEIVDKLISAEIPTPEENPRLHDIIKTNMIHGPCGDWCLNDKKQCSKGYPKSFNDQTTLDEDGYPKYKRRDRGTYTKGSFTFDNRHVVPHNKELLLRLNCHLNVEVVSSIKAVKYLYKYIYKGHDAAAVVIQDSDSNETILQHDEIKQYIETRYVSAPEACARILNKPLHGRSHSVIRLPIHLENQQSIMIDDVNDETGINMALEKGSMLTEYFALNARDPEAKNYTYSEIPLHYVWKKVDNANTWVKRKSQFNVIGRIYFVSPTQTELYHLRLLLTSTRGSISFENLRTVDGSVHHSYVSACLALGLIADDDEWKKALREAETWMMPRQLRQLYVRILIHCQPIYPEKLWEEFKDSFSQDFSRTMPLLQAHRKAYIQISTLLNQENRSLSDFPSMPQVTETEDIENEILPEEHRVIGMSQYQKLNHRQKQIVDIILQRVVNPNANEYQCAFIDGPGGSGKTFVYTTLYHLLRAQEKKICTMAFTGIAATLLPHGKTVHKTFKLPIALYTDSSQTIKAQSKEAQYLRTVDLFIWDEAPMAPRHALELVDRNLRDIMDNEMPFGGKILILGGDFRQLLPVKKNATRSELINLSIKFSPLWLYFTQFALTENMRALAEEAEFAQYLLSIGDGTANIDSCELLLPEDSVAPPDADIASDIYGEIINNKDYEKLAKSAILSARNIDVDDINKRVVNLLDGSTERIYNSINTVKDSDEVEMTQALLPEYLETLNPSNLPPHELRLRLNCIVMLMRNMSVNEGLCNGTRLQVLELSNHLLKCKILTGGKIGEVVFINRVTLYNENDYPFVLGRRQFPVKLAFAMTINKSQGQTFDRIGIDLRRDVFNHGQLYVALSRVRSWDSLKVYLGSQRETHVVQNHVFTELYE